MSDGREDPLERRLYVAERVLTSNGYKRCDIMACNCGSWHQYGGLRARFDELKEVVEEAGYSTNGRTLLGAVKAMIQDLQPQQSKRGRVL